LKYALTSTVFVTPFASVTVSLNAPVFDSPGLSVAVNEVELLEGELIVIDGSPLSSDHAHV
jgi:hypothetical protein